MLLVIYGSDREKVDKRVREGVEGVVHLLCVAKDNRIVGVFVTFGLG